MPTTLQFRRGTTAQNDAFTGSLGEISVDTDLDTLVVHDGTTAGGHTLVTDTATQTLTNKTLTSPNITGLQLGGVAVTSTAAELNILDGVTSTASELNILDGVTSTASELNILDGATLTTTELNYVDGVTSAIQTQLNALPQTDGTNASGTWGISISGTAALATSVTATANNTTNETVYLTFVDGATGTQGIETDTNLTYNPSTNVLSTTATSARYADLAEKYTTDQEYEPGTVVVVGGDAEATACSSYSDHKVLGIISTAPAYLMNSTSEGQDVALIGRVPCKVIGPIERGDLLVTSSTGGHAEAWDPQNVVPGSIIGKALEAKADSGVGVIEVAVGKV